MAVLDLKRTLAIPSDAAKYDASCASSGGNGRCISLLMPLTRPPLLADLKRLARSLQKLKPFVVAADWRPGGLTDRADLPRQLELF